MVTVMASHSGSGSSFRSVGIAPIGPQQPAHQRFIAPFDVLRLFQHLVDLCLNLCRKVVEAMAVFLFQVCLDGGYEAFILREQLGEMLRASVSVTVNHLCASPCRTDGLDQQGVGTVLPVCIVAGRDRAVAPPESP
jgi:hypothetical protein